MASSDLKLEGSMAQCMPCSSRIINEVLPEIRRTDKFDFLKSIIHSQIQSTLVISKSKGPSKTVRDIRTLTYQICSIEEKTI